MWIGPTVSATKFPCRTKNFSFRPEDEVVRRAILPANSKIVQPKGFLHHRGCTFCNPRPTPLIKVINIDKVRPISVKWHKVGYAVP